MSQVDKKVKPGAFYNAKAWKNTSNPKPKLIQ